MRPGSFLNCTDLLRFRQQSETLSWFGVVTAHSGTRFLLLPCVLTHTGLITTPIPDPGLPDAASIALLPVTPKSLQHGFHLHNHGITEWVGKDLKGHLIQIPCHGLGLLQLYQVAQSPV